MKVSPLAGKVAIPSILVKVPELLTAYYSEVPDPLISEQRVAFGTSGHRGSSLDRSFNEWHILAISQAICLYRSLKGIDGPLFLGIDTHALSVPAFKSVIEVLAGNGIEIMIAPKDEYTPTPVISHAILCHNKGRVDHFADGIVITPSHNPPKEGGIKYNPPNGGPAGQEVTNWIESKANEILLNQLKEVKRIPHNKAMVASTTHEYDYLYTYVNDLQNVIDMNLIRDSSIKLGVDPLGGAGVHYWHVIAEEYDLPLEVVNTKVDPKFSFMTVDWDGQIRMDPSSPYAMASLIGLKDSFDVAFACDTDHDRHGIVTRSHGLLPANHFLSVAVEYLFKNRPSWHKEARVGKTVVTSQMIDRIAKHLGRSLYEVPAGFKWFADGLYDGSLAFGGEESAGASFARLDGSVWTTDKDGIILALLAAEMTAKTGKEPGLLYEELTKTFGTPLFDRIEATATLQQKEQLKRLSSDQVKSNRLAGESIEAILTKAPGNDAPIGGLKVVTKNGWFAARPSGTESIYKIYGESFLGKDHLNRILDEAQTVVNIALSN